MYCTANNSLRSAILQLIMSLQVGVKHYCSDLCLPFTKRENFIIYPMDHWFILAACENNLPSRIPITSGLYLQNPSYLGLNLHIPQTIFSSPPVGVLAPLPSLTKSRVSIDNIEPLLLRLGSTIRWASTSTSGRTTKHPHREGPAASFLVLLQRILVTQTPGDIQHTAFPLSCFLRQGSCFSKRHHIFGTICN